MNKKDRKRYEKLLEEERARLTQALGKLESSVLKKSQRDASGDLSAYSIHMADLGTDAMDREKDIQAVSKEGRLLEEIRSALERIDSDEFGKCEGCGNPIETRRLDAVPYARLCLKCQTKAERTPRN